MGREKTGTKSGSEEGTFTAGKESGPKRRGNAADKPETGGPPSIIMELLDSLPQEIRPVLLPQKYPRICARIVAQWKDPVSMISYLEDLVVDRRGGRQGFPYRVIYELNNLKEYFRQKYLPKVNDIWELSKKR
jgi:hypothetical protein